MRTKLGLLWTAAIRTYPDNDRRADKAAANAESTNARFFFDGGNLFVMEDPPYGVHQYLRC